MALWTPYEQEVALDLSKNSLKSESVPITSPSREYFEISASALPRMQPYTTMAASALGAPMSTFAATVSYASNSQRSPIEACVAYAAPALPMQAYAVSHHYPYYGYQNETAMAHVVPSITGSCAEIEQNNFSPPKSDCNESFDEDILSDEEYQDFEKDALQAMAARNGGTLLGNNPRMRRAVQTNQAPDESYRRQRERNNFAAKQSRDRRKIREMRLALQVTFLKKKLAALRKRLITGACDRCSVLNS